MKVMKMTVVAAALSLACASPLFAADNMSKDAHKAEKQRIEPTPRRRRRSART